MLSMSEIKLGTVVQVDHAPYVVTYTQHVKMGRGGAILRTKIKNLITGSVLEKTLKSSDSMEEAHLARSKASFLYADAMGAHFMDMENYDQFTLGIDVMEGKLPFLTEGVVVDILYFNEKPVSLDIPKKITLKVTEAPEGVRGDSSQGGTTKLAVTETGYQLPVPLFVKSGYSIRINTETGEYVERA